jgi:alpha-1,2-mannosyltransferase
MFDFRVYYDAASALISGEQVYGKAFGLSSGFYKYSPLACVFFIPLALLPYVAAAVIYYFLITTGIIFFSIRVSNYVEKERSAAHNLSLPIITGVFLIDHLERELHLGNINLFLLIALFECYHLIRSNREWIGGALLGMVLLFKPHFLLLIPYLIWKKRMSALLGAFISIALGIATPALIWGWERNNELVRNWLFAMTEHNISLQTSPNTIYGLINHTCMNGHAGAWLVIAVLLVVCCLFALLILSNDKREGNIGSNKLRYSEYFLLIALVPNLVHTDTEHFMWIWPMLALAIQFTIQSKHPYKTAAAVTLMVAFIPFAINSPDLVGKQVQRIFDEGGLGIANLMILSVALFAASRKLINQQTI